MDYKKLYQKMFQETTKAIHTLQQAQLECEDMYIEMAEKYDEKISKFSLVKKENTRE